MAAGATRSPISSGRHELSGMEEAQAFQMDAELLQDSLFLSCRSLSVGKIRLYDTYFTHSVSNDDIH